MVQPDGLVVSVPVLVDADIINRARGKELHAALLELCPVVDEDSGARAIADDAAFFSELLEYRADDFDGAEDPSRGDGLPEDLRLYVPEGRQDLRPTRALRKQQAPEATGEPSGDSTPASRAGASYEMLLWRVPDAVDDFDKPETVTGPWDYPAAAKLDRLLRHCRVPIGLLYNSRALRLIYAPHGESSGSITFNVDDMATVGGRPIFDALLMLLSADRFFGYEPERCLPGLLAASRARQADVTEALARQVFDALQILLGGFEAAAERDGWDLLDDALARSRENPNDEHLYAGLLTVLLRLVFVLYAEDRGLLPVDHDFYAEHLSLLQLYEQLADDAAAYPDAMGQRFGAWGRLVALFRAVFEGVAHGALYMPARRGELFSPHAFAFLEGWGPAGTAPIKPLEARVEVDVPSVSDETVYRVLEKLLVLEGQRLSYRALDVEQIGSVYEALMGYHVLRAAEPMVCLRGDKRQRVWLGARELLDVPKSQRAKWLKETLGLSKSHADKIANATSTAKENKAALAELEQHRLKGTETASAGRLILQPGEERRRTSSHYTPRSLSAPIVQRTLEPLIAAMGDEPSSDALLDLKVCDPAMGSGAFLVEACRFLADQVIAAWTREGKTELVASAHEDVTTHARRLVAQRCLYGVDKNPFAVNLAKLSLWLVTLAKGEPFTFVDHCLRCGDSLVGLDLEQIKSFHWDVSAGTQVELCREELEGALEEALGARQGILDLAGDGSALAQREKERLLLDFEDAIDRVRLIGDLVVGAFFAEGKGKAREQERVRRLDLVLEWLRSGGVAPEELRAMQRELRDEAGVLAFHWMAEFPEVFWEGRVDPLSEEQGEAAYLDAFVGNPPFGGKNAIAAISAPALGDWLKQIHEGAHGNADYSAHFFRRADVLLGPHGTIGLIATNTIAQGDTRATALQWLLGNNHAIYEASESMPWPGEAAVSVSVVHLAKGTPKGSLDRRLSGRRVDAINSRLRPKPERPNPMSLAANGGKSFVGSYVLGLGFTLTREERDELVGRDARNAKRILPYIGGASVNRSPTQDFDRYVITFDQLLLEEAERWPDLVAIVREKVKPERDKLKNNADGRRRKQYWWQWGRYTPALYDSVRKLQRCLVAAQVTKHLCFSFQRTDRIFDQKLIVFPFEIYGTFGLLQSRVHELWARLLSSSLEDRLSYTPSDCFETFPFPPDQTLAANSPLDVAGRTFYEARAAYMIATQQGLTQTYNKLKDPDCHDDDIATLRALSIAMDRAVLAAYGWDDLEPPPFADPVSEDEKKARQAFEDEVIDRLFVLNAERAEQERALGIAPGQKKKAKGKKTSSKKKKASGKKAKDDDDQLDLV
ncbi:MAG: N-6 DNA methylase [Myxococcales bacterium]|nr:N-6 DNA methylase [Myxococcales bacterium]